MWWHKDDEAVEFHDISGFPSADESGPQLHHFRSSTLKDEEIYLQQCWQQCIQHNITIPTPTASSSTTIEAAGSAMSQTMCKSWNKDRYVARSSWCNFAHKCSKCFADHRAYDCSWASVSHQQPRSSSPKDSKHRKRSERWTVSIPPTSPASKDIRCFCWYSYSSCYVCDTCCF